MGRGKGEFGPSNNQLFLMWSVNEEEGERLFGDKCDLNGVWGDEEGASSNVVFSEGVETLPFGSDFSHDHSSFPVGAEVALLQRFWSVVLCLVFVLIPLLLSLAEGTDD